jgi:hypothetical protein
MDSIWQQCLSDNETGTTNQFIQSIIEKSIDKANKIDIEQLKKLVFNPNNIKNPYHI